MSQHFTKMPFASRAVVSGAVLALLALLAVVTTSHAAGHTILTGTITAESGKRMGGVVVSARAERQTITTSVFTDEQGNYYFPPSLTKGAYQVWAQAEGFETARAEAGVGDGVVRQDFVLKGKTDFIKQMTGQEYLAALPEDTPQHRRMKDVFVNNCTGCHEASYVLQNRFDQRGWEAVIQLMSKLENGGGNYGGPDEAPFPVIRYYETDLAAYLAEMRGPGPSPMQPKPHPRATGDAARAVIIEYALPVADPATYSQNDGYALNDGSDWSLGTPSRLSGIGGTHDAQMDFNGNLWITYAQPSSTRSLAMVDGKTGKVTNIKVPGANGLAAFTHGLAIDHNGILWFTAAGAGVVDGGVGSLGRIDPNTLKFDIYAPPKGMSGVTLSVDEDGKGKIWASTATGAVRFDPQTHQFTEFKSLTQVNGDGTGQSYGVTGDSEGNGWWTQMFIDRVGKGDGNSKKSSEVKIPPYSGVAAADLTAEDRAVYANAGIFLSDFAGPASQGPRRMGADKNGDSVWVGDYWGSNIAKIDIHTLKTTLYPYPTPYAATYDVVVGKDHSVWANLFNGDAVAKLDPKTGEWTEYPQPVHGIEMRHIAISEQGGRTEIILSYFRTGSVARMQFRTANDMQTLQEQVRESEVQAKK